MRPGGKVMKYKCKYGDFVGIRGAIIGAEIFLFGIELFGMLLGLFQGVEFLRALLWAPWQVYTLFGSILAALYLLCLIWYLCTKSTCTFDENEIVFSDKKGEIRIAKEDLQLIFQQKLSTLLLFLSESFEGYCQTAFLKNNRESEEFNILPHNLRRMKKLGYPVTYRRFPYKTVTKDHVFYFIGRRAIMIELFRVEMVFLNYNSEGPRIDITYRAGDGNLYRDEIGTGFHDAEAIIKRLPKEKFELCFFSYPSTPRAKEHLAFLLERGLVTKEQFDMFR